MKTGKVLGVKVPDEEGRANHLGSASCAGVENGFGAALTGGCAGWVVSPESGRFSGADARLTRGRPQGEVQGRQPAMHRHGQSDGGIGPKKFPNTPLPGGEEATSQGACDPAPPWRPRMRTRRDP
jgi:hypothetical protein